MKYSIIAGYPLPYSPMADKKSEFPNFLSAINRKKKQVFVLAAPNVCAMRRGGVWQYCLPLSDREMLEYELVIDLDLSRRFVEQACEALEKKKLH